mgnify:CR=1 FL=1
MSAPAALSRGDLLRALYVMSDALGRMVHQVRQSTDSIAIASAIEDSRPSIHS